MLRQFMRPMGSVSRIAFSRTFASKSVVPPVQLYGLDGTYATALYVAAGKDSSIEAIEKSLTNLQEIFTNDPKSEEILIDPSLDGKAKSAVIEELVKAAKGDKVLKGFLETLASYNRLGLINDVIAQYGTLYSAYKGIVKGSVTSAAPLDAKSLKRVEKAIQNSKYVGEGKTLVLENLVVPSILGGLIVNIGDRTADLSIQSQIQKYNSLLAESI